MNTHRADPLMEVHPRQGASFEARVLQPTASAVAARCRLHPWLPLTG